MDRTEPFVLTYALDPDASPPPPLIRHLLHPLHRSPCSTNECRRPHPLRYSRSLSSPTVAVDNDHSFPVTHHRISAPFAPLALDQTTTSPSYPCKGYIEAIREIEQQTKDSFGGVHFDDIAVACGSGGTIAGLSLGSALSSLKAKVHAFSVCDDPDYFYDYSQGLLDGLQAGVNSHDIINIQDAKGLGYALSTEQELQFVKNIAATTGVILDPVYSGKAAYILLEDISENPEKWKGRKILFIHTGGLLGLFDKTEQLASMTGNWKKMELGESIARQDGLGKMF